MSGDHRWAPLAMCALRDALAAVNCTSDLGHGITPKTVTTTTPADDRPWNRLLRHAQQRPNQLALVDASRSLTRAALIELVHRELAQPTTLADVAINQLAAQFRGESDLEVFTSGTSGTPRVLRRSVQSWAASLAPFAELTDLHSDDLVWAPGSHHSTLSQYAIWVSLWVGAPVYADGPWPRRKPTSDIDRRDLLDQVTVVHTVPTVLARLLEERSRGAFPALRLAVVAGEPLRANLRQRAADQGLPLIEYYGAAELSFVAIDVDGSGLRPFPGVELSVGPRHELRVRSPYLADDVAGPDGWARAPDHADLITAGPDDVRLRIIGRPDAALVGGTTVLLAEIEDRLAMLTELIEVVTVADSHPLLGQRVAVVATVSPDCTVDQARTAITAFTRNLAPAARPGRVMLSHAPLPRTPGGKLDRAALGGGLR